MPSLFVKLRPLSLLVLLCAPTLPGQSVSTSATGSAPTTEPGPSTTKVEPYRANPKFADALREANKQKKQRQASNALDAYKKASKLAGGQCYECLQGMFESQMLLGSFKDAIASSMAMQAIAPSPASRSVAAFFHGQALLAQGGEKPKPAQLQAAHDALQQAIAAYPKNIAALFTDGRVLAQIGRMDDARANFQKCVGLCGPADPARLRAAHFAENPELALHKMAPAFEVTALDGSSFNLDAMGGRVVLIDFWATWCGPCNAELPHMRKIAKEFEGQPLVIISVSWDSDEDKWRQFVAKNGMTWVQYRDADHKLAESFGIYSIPHYFTIDSDGVLTAEMVGQGSNVEGNLKKLLAKARETQAAGGASGNGK